jgi:uncharacterized membrane protein
MKDLEKYIILFIIGGIGYGIIEILFRGYTHWSMIITGGTAFLSLYIINNTLTDTSIFIKALFGMIVITALEFTVGIIVNKIFQLQVWDYTNMPGNIMGQITFQFSACWYGLSIVSFIIFDNIHFILDLQKS